MLKLYWAPQSRAVRALWMMEEAGLPYERVLVDIRSGDQSTADYARVNPMMKVPALSDGDVSLAESAAICAYMAEKAPHLAPAVGNPERGRYLHALFFAANCIEGALAEKMGTMQVPSMQAGWGSFDRVVGVMENWLEKGPWLLGEQFSAADVMFGSDLNFGVNVFGVIDRRPAFTAYLDRCKERPAFRRAHELDAAGA
ncbi:MAG: glutathione S-transferase family protein [Sphingomonadales bacterium]